MYTILKCTLQIHLRKGLHGFYNIKLWHKLDGAPRVLLCKNDHVCTYMYVALDPMNLGIVFEVMICVGLARLPIHIHGPHLTTEGTTSIQRKKEAFGSLL